MQRQFRKFAWLMLAALVTLSLFVGAVAAHEGRPVGEYRFIVGWLEEPAYEGFQNAVSVRVSKVIDSEETAMGVQQEEHGEPGHHGEDSGSTSPETREDSDEGEDHHGNESQDSDEGEDHHATEASDSDEPASGGDAGMAGQHEGMMVPVEGLEGVLQVEVTYVGSGASRIFDLEAAWGDPGHYVAGVIPTASGVYEFRIFGSIEGTSIDETFASVGGGGGFDDIRPSADLQFPERLPELREVVGAVQGARETAQQAQDAVLAADEGGSNTLALMALILGIAGVVVAGIAFVAVAVLPALRRQ